MADQSIARGREAAGGEAVWPPAGGRRPAWAWPDSLGGLARPIGKRLRAWALADVGPGRLVPWLAISFGLGIILYFTADREPAPWAAMIVFVVAVAGAAVIRNRVIAFPLALALAAASAGFLAATAKRGFIAHPVLQAAAWNVDIAGFVEAREERERSDRIVVRVHRISGKRLDQPPERVRVSVRKGTAPPVASYVEFKARLSPPLEPLRPGGYDFARSLYFQGIGASGFVLGRIRTVEPPLLPGLKLRAAAAIDAMRDALDRRIRAVLAGDRGAIASALITGKRDAISTPLNDAMFVSGLGHVLSISGYHMAVVAGVIFFVLRALFALMPATAGHFPVKKWAALAALFAAAFYLVLSGAEVATQRSFIMIAIVLIGVMVDRPAITLRTLTAAAIIVLLLTPEAIVHPSFQMSFAATLALVAGYECGLSWMSAAAETPMGMRVALWGGRAIVGLVIVSLLAGFATTLFAAYHFHRLAPYGVIANLLAMPFVSAWTMPMGILGVVLMPLGLDGFAWYLMGWGIDWMIAIALWVASLPGAVGRMAAFGIGPLLVGSAGLVLLCLLKSPLRLTGVALLAVASVWAVRTPQPDVLVAADGLTFAVRGSDGRLSIVRGGSDTFAVRQWLAADADPRSHTDASLGAGIRCDGVGCVGRLADGRLVALARSLEALEEDCRRAAVVASPLDAPAGCAATVIDRGVLRRTGTVALRRSGEGFAMSAVRPQGYDRPWAQARPPVGDAGTPAAGPPASRTPPRDATPRPEDLEPGD
ncbi:MAG: ComEC/Rec2 family competence protein [Xanthobacteraceae bacterium]|nr:ComEC/Rec2 family competence protein [Xanthobacteraceae bacterium]